ncbi:MAG: hypothetical protein K2I34_07915 [Paramuribaculum sp.]|nr:hypothetical protein [Paramuribaculum sp.]MDE5920797.1 hypothetical protein [Paramuribaculum sp.]
MTERSGRQGRRRISRTFWHCLTAIVLLAYLVTALCLSSEAESERRCTGLRIAVNDTTSMKFVTAGELARELGNIPSTAKGMRLLDIDTDSIERILSRIDKIESVQAVRLNDGYVLVTVDPMRPVARVFDGDKSYYINREGKRISADARYHIDVPVIQGRIDDTRSMARDILPLIDYIASDSLWNSLVSMIKIDSPTDVMLVPIIRGQIINFGSPDNFDNKFGRLRRMYTEVLPVKGWNNYDTISVKWSGQIVATRRHKQLSRPAVEVEEIDEADDIGTMLAADGIAPGTALPGQKPRQEKPIPASKPHK